MNKNYWRLLISGLVISIVFSSCSPTNFLTLGVAEPSQVFIPSNIKTIGIIDRSLPSKENEKLDKLDKILSLEYQNIDAEAAYQSIVGLQDELLKNNRFSEVKIIGAIDSKNSGTGIFPTALFWNEIEQICNEQKVSAIFELSFYDTDTRIDYKAVPIEIGGPLGIKVPLIEHHATVFTTIKTGWRIYDPTSKLILDEYVENELVESKGVGINPTKAIEAIVGRKQAVLQVSNNMGHNYAFRVIPYTINVQREYYVRGSENFKVAKRYAQTGNWDGAAELWFKEVSNAKSKIAGRACYNMAIINEINGDLNAAVEWASKSYADHKNKMALGYLNVLKYRIERNAQLQQEMN